MLVIDDIPGDKSISHRAVICASLADGESVFHGFLCSEDCLHTTAIFEALGVDIRLDGTQISIQGTGPSGLKKTQKMLDVGNSGTGIRLISGVLSALPFSSIITGDSSIQKRPMGRIITPLTAMGASIESNGEFPPLTIHGNPEIRPNFSYTLPVASAQVKSAVLLAAATAGVSVSVIEPEPCRDHTERMLALYGVTVDATKGMIQVVQPKLKAPRHAIQIPKDISSALFFIVWAALAEHPILLRHIGLNESRTRALDICRAMGVSIGITHHPNSYEPMGDITIDSNSNLVNVDVPLDWIPNVIDELPILAILATKARGVFRVRGAGELRVKESDRIAGICRLIQALGGHAVEYEDGFDIHGMIPFKKSFEFDAHHDHRLAMAALIAQNIANMEGQIHGLESIATSFPNFLNVLESLPQSRTNRI